VTLVADPGRECRRDVKLGTLELASSLRGHPATGLSLASACYSTQRCLPALTPLRRRVGSSHPLPKSLASCGARRAAVAQSRRQDVSLCILDRIGEAQRGLGPRQPPSSRHARFWDSRGTWATGKCLTQGSDWPGGSRCMRHLCRRPALFLQLPAVCALVAFHLQLPKAALAASTLRLARSKSASKALHLRSFRSRLNRLPDGLAGPGGVWGSLANLYRSADVSSVGSPSADAQVQLRGCLV